MIVETQGLTYNLKVLSRPVFSNPLPFCHNFTLYTTKMFLGPCQVNKVQETISPGCIVNWKPLHANWRSRGSQSYCRFIPFHIFFNPSFLPHAVVLLCLSPSVFPPSA